MTDQEILAAVKPGTPLYAILAQRVADQAKIKALTTHLRAVLKCSAIQVACSQCCKDAEEYLAKGGQ